MALPADKLQVVPAQSHTRIRNVLRSDVCLVVDYLSGGEPSVPQAALAQSAHAPGVRLPAVRPRF